MTTAVVRTYNLNYHPMYIILSRNYINFNKYLACLTEIY